MGILETGRSISARDAASLLGMSEEFETLAPLASEMLTPEVCGRLRFLLRTDRKGYLAAMEQQTPAERLLFCLMMAGEVWEQYQMAGIDSKIWLDTMSDIRIWSEKYRRETGKIGLVQTGWLAHHLTLEIFRLGRLQFEPTRLEEPVPSGAGVLEPGTPALSVHIAAGEPLNHDAALASYEQAKAFFKNPAPLFICYSWLLSPALPELLPPESNILAFQRDYTLFGTDEADRQAEERIFGAPCDDFSAYPERTSLQRRAKAWLLSGKKIPSGAGFFYDCRVALGQAK